MSNGARTKSRRSRRSGSVLLVLLLAGAALVPSAAAAPRTSLSIKNYEATATATAAVSGATVTVTLTNCGCSGVSDSNQSFGSAEVRFPSVAGLVASGSMTDRAGWSVHASQVGDRTVLRLTSGRNPGVKPSESVTVTIPSPASRGPVAFTTAVKQANDFSGTGNDFTRFGAEPTVAAASTPAGLAFALQPSTVQSSGSPPVSSPGLTAKTLMCGPAPSVRLVDGAGVTVPTSGVRVTLEPAGGGDDPVLSGPLTATTVNGVATFGDCLASVPSGISAVTLGRGYQLVASATGLTSATSDAFDVLQTYGTCTGECSVAPRTGPADTTERSTTAGLTAVPAVGTTGGRLSFGVGQTGDGWTTAEQAACDPDPGGSTDLNPYRAVVTVDLGGYDKTVTLRWSKQAVQWATNNGSSQWRVCLAAEAPFAAVGGTSTDVVDSRWFVGTLLPCGDILLAATDPCVRDLRRNGGDQIATVVIPDRPGDPRMI